MLNRSQKDRNYETVWTYISKINGAFSAYDRKPYCILIFGNEYSFFMITT
ncbi:hypothetical protein PATA110616_00365 [Paenibacillus tarimensis]